jgi:hypothetical protein
MVVGPILKLDGGFGVIAMETRVAVILVVVVVFEDKDEFVVVVAIIVLDKVDEVTVFVDDDAAPHADMTRVKTIISPVIRQ